MTVASIGLILFIAHRRSEYGLYQTAMSSLVLLIGIVIASFLSGYMAVFLDNIIYHSSATPILDFLLKRTIGLLFIFFSDSDDSAITFLFFISFGIIVWISSFLIKILIYKFYYPSYEERSMKAFALAIISAYFIVSIISCGLSKVELIDQKSINNYLYDNLKTVGCFIVTLSNNDMDEIKQAYLKQ